MCLLTAPSGPCRVVGLKKFLPPHKAMLFYSRKEAASMDPVALGAATHVLAVHVVMPWWRWGPAALSSGKALLKSEGMQSFTEPVFGAEVSHTL